MKNLVLKATLNDPIYHQNVTLYVVRDGDKTLRRIHKFYGVNYAKMKGFGALTLSKESDHAVILLIEDLTEATIAHEVKHLMEYIMDWVAGKTCKKCKDEPGAYLLGYLSDWVKRKLRKAKLIS